MNIDDNGDDGVEIKRSIRRSVSLEEGRKTINKDTISTPKSRDGDDTPDISYMNLGFLSKRASAFTEHVVEEVMHVFDVHAPTAKYAWNKSHTKMFRNAGHLEENWEKEFLDLILVAALIKLGDGLHHCGLTVEEYFFVAVEFFILFKTRYMMDEFMWHFYMDDLWNQILYFLFISGVFIMALMVSYSHEAVKDSYSDKSHTYQESCSLELFNMNLFFVGLITTRIVLSLYWLVELIFDEEARDVYYMIPIRNSISIVLSCLGLILNASQNFDRFYNYYILAALVFAEYYLNFYKAIHKYPLIDLNTMWPLKGFEMKLHDHDHEKLFECDEELKAVQDRCGQFMLIVLGESMIQLLIPSFQSEYRDRMMMLTLIGLLLVWSVAKQFFDAAQRVPHDHALRRCMQSGMLWIVFHSIAGWFAFLMGIGIKLLYEDLREDVDATDTHLLCVSIGCGGAVMSFTVMRFLHKGWGKYPDNSNRILGYLLRTIIAGLHFSVIGWGIREPEYLVLAHCFIAVLLNSLDLYNFKEQHVLEIEDSGDDNQSDTKSESSYGGDMTRNKSNNSLDGMMRSFGVGSVASGDSSALSLNIFKGRQARVLSRKDTATPLGSKPRSSPSSSPQVSDDSRKRMTSSKSNPNFVDISSPSLSTLTSTFTYDGKDNNNIIQVYDKDNARPSSDSNLNLSNLNSKHSFN